MSIREKGETNAGETERVPDDTLCFEVFTLFPSIVEAFAREALMGRAMQEGKLALYCTNYRDFADDRRRTVDDTPCGGGAGMVIGVEAVVKAIESVEQQRGPMHKVFLTPAGPRFDQRAAERISKMSRVAFVCGRYEGIDERVRQHWCDESFSLGDFVLNGGEVAAAAMMEAIGRLKDGVLGNAESVVAESFGDEENQSSQALLEHPQYTRPIEFRGHQVPTVLLSGDHQMIAEWRTRKAIERTWTYRPELRPTIRQSATQTNYLLLSGSRAPAVIEQEFSVPDSSKLEFWVIGQTHKMKTEPEVDGVRTAIRKLRSARDLRDFRRQARKQSGIRPWLVGVDGGRESAALGTVWLESRLVVELDCLMQKHHMRELPPIAIWIVDRPADLPKGSASIDAWVSPDEYIEWQAGDAREGEDGEKELAKVSGMIKSSHPQRGPAAVGGEPEITSHLLEVIRRLRTRGLRFQPAAAQKTEESPEKKLP